MADVDGINQSVNEIDLDSPLSYDYINTISEGLTCKLIDIFDKFTANTIVIQEKGSTVYK